MIETMLRWVNPKSRATALIPNLQVAIARNKRLKRISFTMVSGPTLVVRVPANATEARVQRAINSSLPAIERLRRRFERNTQHSAATDLTKSITAVNGEILFVKGEQEGFKVKKDIAEIYFSQENSPTLHKTIESCLARLAKKYLISRCNFLSQLHNLPFNSVRIKKVRTIWGSCSARKNINLSARLILLNEKLVDYVIAHELTHTKHRNHGKLFWGELNRITNGAAKELDKELSAYNYPLKDVLERGHIMHVS